jgi:hypothetical protein
VHILDVTAMTMALTRSPSTRTAESHSPILKATLFIRLNFCSKYIHLTSTNITGLPSESPVRSGIHVAEGVEGRRCTSAGRRTSGSTELPGPIWPGGMNRGETRRMNLVSFVWEGSSLLPEGYWCRLRSADNARASCW